jgi:aminoglycoside phosphotransferase (APT) family kinase protein
VPTAFQRPVPPDVLRRITLRAFGATPTTVTPLPHGAYNTTYLLTLPSVVELGPRPPDPDPAAEVFGGAAGGGAGVGPGVERRVILRVAPEVGRQFRSERFLLRAELAATPFLAGLGELVPRVLAADFTHQLLDRDYLITTVLPGRPGPEALPEYPRGTWAPFFRDLGRITAQVHSVRGPAFGPLAGPAFPTWSAALAAAFTDLAADLALIGNTPAARAAAALATAAEADRAVLDEITEPRLLHGDLWTVNTMIGDGPEPRVTGVFDHDRAWWGDPLADWPIFMARRKPGSERESFWDTYPVPPTTPARAATAARRATYYRARHQAAIVLEHHRLANAPAAEIAAAAFLDTAVGVGG